MGSASSVCPVRRRLRADKSARAVAPGAVLRPHGKSVSAIFAPGSSLGSASQFLADEGARLVRDFSGTGADEPCPYETHRVSKKLRCARAWSHAIVSVAFSPGMGTDERLNFSRTA